MLIYIRNIYSRQTDSSAAGDAFYRGDLLITFLASEYPDADWDSNPYPLQGLLLPFGIFSANIIQTCDTMRCIFHNKTAQKHTQNTSKHKIQGWRLRFSFLFSFTYFLVFALALPFAARSHSLSFCRTKQTHKNTHTHSPKRPALSLLRSLSRPRVPYIHISVCTYVCTDFTTMKNACFFFTKIRFSALDFHTFSAIARCKFDVIPLAVTAQHTRTHFSPQFINYFPHFLPFLTSENDRAAISVQFFQCDRGMTWRLRYFTSANVRTKV